MRQNADQKNFEYGHFSAVPYTHYSSSKKKSKILPSYLHDSDFVLVS